MNVIYHLSTFSEKTGKTIYSSPVFFKTSVSAFEFFLKEVQEGNAPFNYGTDHILIVHRTLKEF